MLRGTIEQVNRDLVSGWVYSGDAPVRGRLVLAFLDDGCVGGGRIEHHRPDLEAAGLGDGYLGFSFPITLPQAADLGRVVVRLENSDALLIQPGAKVIWPDTALTGPMTKAKADGLIESYKWMLSRGWLKQSDYDYLRSLAKFGIYERTLVAQDQAGAAHMADAKQLANELLSLLHQVAVESTEHRAINLDAYEALVAGLRDQPGRSAFAMWTGERCVVSVAEGSHLGGADPELAHAAGVRVKLDPERLLVADAHCSIAFPAEFPPGGLRIFTFSDTPKL